MKEMQVACLVGNAFVAVLFLLEVDNLAFLHGLSERTRMEAEEMAGVHEHVTEHDLQSMDAVKLACVLAIPGVVLAGPWGAWVVRDFPETLAILISPVPSMSVLFLQRVKARGLKLKVACGGVGRGLAGYLSCIIWYALMMELAYLMAHEKWGGTAEDDD